MKKPVKKPIYLKPVDATYDPNDMQLELEYEGWTDEWLYELEHLENERLEDERITQ